MSLIKKGQVNFNDNNIKKNILKNNSQRFKIDVSIPQEKFEKEIQSIKEELIQEFNIYKDELDSKNILLENKEKKLIEKEYELNKEKESLFKEEKKLLKKKEEELNEKIKTFNKEKVIILKKEKESLFETEKKLLKEKEEELNKQKKLFEDEKKSFFNSMDETKEKIKKEGYAIGLKEGTEKGYSDGLKKGENEGKYKFEQIQKETEKSKLEYEKSKKSFDENKIKFENTLKDNEQTIKKLFNKFNELHEHKNLILKNTEPYLLELLETIIKKVLANTIEADKSILLSTIQKALEPVTSGYNLTIKVHPDSVTFLEENKSKLVSDYTSIKKYNIIGDKNLCPGGCLIEADLGIIDARIESKIAEIMSLFNSNSPKKALNNKNQEAIKNTPTLKNVETKNEIVKSEDTKTEKKQEKNKINFEDDDDLFNDTKDTLTLSNENDIFDDSFLFDDE
jgi:flagellar biosynthesis/type III secretory pathway protein FliH